MDIAQLISSTLNGMMEYLAQTAADPFLYSVVLFLYAILAAIFLPIPVEFGLLLSPHTPVIWLALLLGMGKMVGSFLVFYLGLGIGDKIRVWSERWTWFDWLVDKSEYLVARMNYLGLYFILSIPLMPDTIPLYIFSILNENGVFSVQMFGLVNLCAGFTRAALLFISLSIFGIDLFH